MTIIIAIFFVIFDENDILYIPVKFETDRMSPRESAENGRNGAHGLNCKIFVNFEFRYEIYDKNHPRKKNFMSLRPFWNFRHPTWMVPTYKWIFLLELKSALFLTWTLFRRWALKTPSLKSSSRSPRKHSIAVKIKPQNIPSKISIDRIEANISLRNIIEKNRVSFLVPLPRPVKNRLP